MINQESLEMIAHATFVKNFCKPLYESYCFSKIPETIKSLFLKKECQRLPLKATGPILESYDSVILLFVDGFGWQFFEKYASRYPFLNRFIEKGIATKITSQFPSTTAAHVTCINTGLPVGESGVYEWFYYEPKLDRVIAPLLFSFAGDKELNTLKATGISPEDLYPTHTLYEELKKEGVDSYVIQHSSITHSPYSQVMFKGAHPVSYQHGSEALQKLSRLHAEFKGKRSYFYLYFGEIDSMGHRHGIHSPEFERAVDHWWSACEDILWKCLQQSSQRTACLIVADHGMIPIDPKTTRYLNIDLPQIIEMIKRNREGRLIAPAGSCRDFFLHVQEEKLEEAKKLLESYLQDRAAVFRTQDLIAQHFFGAKISQTFLSRVGNLVIVPYGNDSFWWYEKHRFEQLFYAMHGGLTREEMETIFLFLPLTD